MTEQNNAPETTAVSPLAALPSSELLREASAEDLRVLVCLLAGTSAAPAALAKAAGCSQARVRGALAYWQEAGVTPESLRAANKHSAAAEKTTAADDSGKEAPEVPAGTGDTAPAKTDATQGAPARKALMSARELSPRAESENAAYIRDNDLLPLLDACQQQMGRHFNPSEMAVIVGLSEQLGLDDAYILTLVNHCVRTGKKTLRYLEKMAIGLYDDGIDTAEALDAHLKRQERASTAEGKLRRLFGIGDRSLSHRERDCFTRWVADYGFDMEVIGLAYDITVDTKQKALVSYADTILKRWYEAGCRDLPSVEALLERERLAMANPRPAARPRTAAGAGGKAAAPLGGSFDTDDFFNRALERSYGKKPEDLSPSGKPKAPPPKP